MFTGIIEELGKIDGITRSGNTNSIRIRCEKVLGTSDDPTSIGDSISVNGICLTVTELDDTSFTADVMPETISRTSLSGLAKGSSVDLERALPASGRFGGHIVSGHIDGTGKIRRKYNDENAVWFEIEAPGSILSLIVEKGSIAIDGISLTVAYVDDSKFRVSIIPHTMKETVLQEKEPGDIVNLENDIVGKYIHKLAGKGFDKDEELLSLL